MSRIARRLTIAEARAMPLTVDDLDLFETTTRAQGVQMHPSVKQSLVHARTLLGIVEAIARAGNDLVSLGDELHLGLRWPATVDFGAVSSHIATIRTLRSHASVLPSVFKDWVKLVTHGAQIVSPHSRAVANDDLWECLNAAALASFASNLVYNSKRPGVDAKAEFRGSAWCIESKVLYSGDVQRRIDRIIEGVKQLEEDRSVERGVVALNITNCMRHGGSGDAQPNLLAVHATDDEAIGTLAAVIRDVALEIVTPTFLRRFHADKSGTPRSKCRGLIFVGQAVVMSNGGIKILSSQVSLLRERAELLDRVFVNRYFRFLTHL